MSVAVVCAVRVMAWEQFASGGKLTGVNVAVTITSPTSASTYDNGSATTITLSGTAVSDSRIASCSYTGPNGSGSATGTTSWTASNVSLNSGSNTVTITCLSEAGTTGTDTLTVTVSTGCTTTVSATPSQSTFLGYANGTVVCFNAGSYTINYASATSRTGFVTYKSVTGRVANFTMTIDNVRWLTIDSVTFVAHGSVRGCSLHIHLSNFTWSPNVPGLLMDGDTCAAGVTDQDLVIDGGTFDRVQLEGNFEGRLGLMGTKGMIVKNSTFSGNPTNGALASDGIQTGFSSTNTTIGPHNYFTGMYQNASSGPHVDSFQCYNGNGGTGQFPMEIVSNYFYDSTIFLGFYGGNCGGLNIHNNVFDTGGTNSGASNCEAIQMGGLTNVHMHHNTFKNFACGWGIGTQAGMPINAQWTVENNIFDGASTGFGFDGDQPGCGTVCTVRYNLRSNGATLARDDGNNVIGNAIYSGTLSFANWANWLLSSGSPGENAGNDGSDMGTLYYGS